MTRFQPCEIFTCSSPALPLCHFCRAHYFRLSFDERKALTRAQAVFDEAKDPLVKEQGRIQLNNVIGNCRDALAMCERRTA
jgi:hypothetical protein